MVTYNASVISRPDGATDTETVAVPPFTVQELLGLTPWYTAHRGSSGENPEHTKIAWDNSIAIGAQSLEISCITSSDNILFGFHDSGDDSPARPGLSRVTNSTGDATTRTWADLSANVQVNIGQRMLGPAWPDQPLPLLQDVLDAYVGNHVLFLEPKTAAAQTALQALLTARYPSAPSSIVWKQYFKGTGIAWAKQRGYFTWAYIDGRGGSAANPVPATTMAEMDAVESNVDIWGVPVMEHIFQGGNNERIFLYNWDQITQVINRPISKPVMCWEVHRRHERDRLLSLGVDGMMCSQYQYVTSSEWTPQTTDNFATQLKAPGNFGGNLRTKDDRLDPDYAMKWDTAAGNNVVYFDRLLGTSMALGSFCPTPPSYRLKFDMMFPVLPGTGLHAGIYFGKTSDDRYQFSSAENETPGYHAVIRPTGTASNGLLQLYTHAVGTTTGTQIGTANMPLMTAGQWGTFEIDMNPTQVIIRRTDTDPDVTVTANNIAFRGRYLGTHNGSLTNRDTCPRFRNITITAL
jgi:glycerophosphoryl diester phosphodiesterase